MLSGLVSPARPVATLRAAIRGLRCTLNAPEPFRRGSLSRSRKSGPKASTAGAVDTANGSQSVVEALRLQLFKKEKEIAALKIALEMETAQEAKRDEPPPNFGFYTRVAGVYLDGEAPNGMPTVPSSFFALAARTFAQELKSIGGALAGTKEPVDPAALALQEKLNRLTLSNDAIWEREGRRPEIRAPLLLKVPYLVLCFVLDKAFDGRPIDRFWFLETVARMPYFSYITMLHTYETLGWWRIGAAAKKIHFAQEWNEYHHLLTMESMGGDRKWSTRFLAGHASIVYYFVLIGLWLISPTLAYNFSELIEAHAVDTYAQFADENEALLREIPAPNVARAYYTSGDLYMFDEMNTSKSPGTRRPKVESLYDVFCNIRDDEGQHVETMNACQDEQVMVRSPNYEAAIALATAAAALATNLVSMMPSGMDEAIEMIEENGDAVSEIVSASSGIVDVVTDIISKIS